MNNVQKVVDTGTTVIQNIGDGVFSACQSKQSLCGYACCKFGKLGNWIYTLPGELEIAQAQNLSTEHLNIEPIEGDEGHRVECLRPCVDGEFKPLDCALYPLFVADYNEQTNQLWFIVADHRKCPISNDALLGHTRMVADLCMKWESEHPGTLEGMSKASKGFTAYQPYPYVWNIESRKFDIVDEEQVKKITPLSLLAPDYVPEWKGDENVLAQYTATTTPDDTGLIQE